jgi:hypothetical protein
MNCEATVELLTKKIKPYIKAEEEKMPFSA